MNIATVLKKLRQDIAANINISTSINTSTKSDNNNTNKSKNALKNITCFCSKEYSPLFSLYLRNFLDQATNKNLSVISLEDKTELDLNAQLYVSFLGNNSYYWVSSRISLLKNRQSFFKKYIFNYSGPHHIFIYDAHFLSTEFDKKSATIQPLLIEIPWFVNKQLYKELYAILFNQATLNLAFINKIFSKKNTITLEEASQFMSYQTVIGSRSNLFFDQWVNQLIDTNKSFFILGQYLLGNNKKLFFEYWAPLYKDYPPEFWIAFFSDLLWQAALFIHRIELHNFIEAKKEAYKLPFSFINKDWRNYTLSFLQKAHDHLYKVDYNQKNTISSCGLDLWCSQFFLKRF